MNERSLAENSTRADPRKTGKRSLPKVDFLRPAGAPALYAPDSLAWQIFKNPVSLFIGGITDTELCPGGYTPRLDGPGKRGAGPAP